MPCRVPAVAAPRRPYWRAKARRTSGAWLAVFEAAAEFEAATREGEPMRWTERFASRVMSMDDAVGLVRNGDRIMGGLPEPSAFLEALAARQDLTGVEVFVGAPRTGGVAIAGNPGFTLY